MLDEFQMADLGRGTILEGQFSVTQCSSVGQVQCYWLWNSNHHRQTDHQEKHNMHQNVRHGQTFLLLFLFPIFCLKTFQFSFLNISVNKLFTASLGKLCSLYRKLAYVK